MKYPDNFLSFPQHGKTAFSISRLGKISSCFNKYNFFLLVTSLAFLTSSFFLFPDAAAASTSRLTGVELGKALEQGLKNGQAIWLDDGKDKFFAIFNPDQSGQPKGGVIILHDADSQPDNPEVIQPLRRELPLHGWVTISIQLPYLDNPNNYADHQETINNRINSAITYMHNAGISNLVLLGHGTGTLAATSYLANQPNGFIQAFVAISLGILHENDATDSIISQLEKITLPILDIYGSNDLDLVTSSANVRARAARISSNIATRNNQLGAYMRSAIAKSNNQKQQGYISYRQIRIEGASHDFSGSESQLTKRIIGWLERHAKGVAITSSR